VAERQGVAHNLRITCALLAQPLVLSIVVKVESSAVALQLREPDSETLDRAPLELVVFQAKHEVKTVVSEPATALGIQWLLKHDYPTLEQAATAEFVFEAGPVGMQTSGGETRPGWRLRSSDNKWTVVLMPDFIALESTGYTTWTHFNERLSELVVAVHEVVAPEFLQRVGLRYIDKIKIPEAARPEEWTGWVDSSLLTLASMSQFKSSVIGSQTITQLDLGDVQSIFRTSCAPDPGSSNGYSMVLDTDCFDSRGRGFNAADIDATVSTLHRRSLQIFQGVLTPRMNRALKG
jgi:uncharacterized protein (TIGR04255 family)